MSDIFEITKAATFDAAHHLNNGPTDNPYRRMHGHSFRVEATVRGPASEPDGWVADLGAWTMPFAPRRWSWTTAS